MPVAGDLPALLIGTPLRGGDRGAPSGSLNGVRDTSSDSAVGRTEDEQGFADGLLPHLDDAERRGRLRIMRTDDGGGLLLAAVYDRHRDWQERC